MSDIFNNCHNKLFKSNKQIALWEYIKSNKWEWVEMGLEVVKYFQQAEVTLYSSKYNNISIILRLKLNIFFIILQIPIWTNITLMFCRRSLILIIAFMLLIDVNKNTKFTISID